ncbi:MAG TPA: TonB-dependent receptor [Gammaproteobacteria bacterium]
MHIHRKRTLATKVLLLGSVIASSSAVAQEAIEEIFVTGSRIARDEFSSPAPISVFDSQDITNSGAVSVDEFLKDIPAFTGFQFGTSTNNGNIGTKAIDLRGLDFKRTLVLINGRRQVGSFIGSNADIGAVDLNSIPSSMIERVEVLKDGASTIYGSDALAGVVNIILKDDFEGAEFSMNYGAGTDEMDAENYGFSALIGTSSSNGNVVAGFEYNRQKEMLQAERDWSFYDIHPLYDSATGTFIPTASGSSNSRRMLGVADHFDAAALAQLQAQTTATQFIVDATTGQARPFTAADVYNYAPVNAIVTPNERYQLSGMGTYDLSDNIRTFAEVLYTRRTSHQRLAPDASFAVTDYNGLPNDFVPASNPGNPFGVNPANPYGISGQGIRINRRFEESGGRLFSQSVDTYRIMLGLEGDLGDNMTWEVAYDWAQNEDFDETKFYHRFDRWQTMVDPALCGADPACVDATGGLGYLDPFGPFGTIDPANFAYLMAGSLKDVRQNQMRLYSANLTGEAERIEFAGGSLEWSVGFEHRNESADYIPDEFVAGGLTTGGAGDPLSGGYSVDELYGEVYLPLGDQFSVDASARHSDYNTSAGSETTYRLGANYEPTDNLSFRGVYSTGFRAPNIVELYGGDQTDFPLVEWPCEFWGLRTNITPTTIANCQAAGVTDPLYELGFQWQSVYTTLSPPTLDPEESTNWSIGVVWESARAEGLSVSVDYWDIEVDNFIDSIPFNEILFACLGAAVQATDPACALTSTGTGVIGGEIPDDAVAPIGNLGLVETDGVDVNFNYDRSVDWGTFNGISVVVGGTFLNSYQETFPVTGTQERAGTATYSELYPEVKLNTAFTLNANRFALTWATRYYSEMDDNMRPPEITNDAVAESIWYHDIYTNWNIGDRFTITAGLNNITDEDPPQFHSAFNAETEPGVYDVIGRRLFTSFTLSF